jgi:hypothetical protein
MKRLQKVAGRRTAKGSFFTEFGPALYLLFIGIFFPLLDLISLSFVYGCGFTLNYFQACQCASVPKSEATDPTGLVMYGIPQQWQANGLGRFVPIVGNPETSVTYTDGQMEKLGVQDKNIILSTTITTRPLICVPIFPGIPGFTAPVTMNFTTERPLENPDDANS